MPSSARSVSQRHEAATQRIRLRGGHARLRPIELTVSGYKHALVQLVASAFAVGTEVVIRNAPRVADTLVLAEIIREGGGRAHWQDGQLSVDARGYRTPGIPAALSELVHGTLYLAPAVLGHLGEVVIGKTGGCALGDGKGGGRPVDHVWSVLRRFGAHFEEQDDWVRGRCVGLMATELDIMGYSARADYPCGPRFSGASKTAIIAAAFAAGTSRILHPYRKPDVTETLALLHAAGFATEMDATAITITPPPTAPEGPIVHDLVSCISEVMTWIALAVHARIPLTLTGLTVDRVARGLRAELELLEQMGIVVELGQDRISIPVPGAIRPCDIQVTAHGIYSDHQPLFALMLLGADGVSTIRDDIWSERFDYARELVKLGAEIELHEGAIRIHPSRLTWSPHPIVATNVRSAAVLLLAASMFEGTSEVVGVHHLARGYPDLLGALCGIGVEIEHIDEPGQVPGVETA